MSLGRIIVVVKVMWRGKIRGRGKYLLHIKINKPWSEVTDSISYTHGSKDKTDMMDKRISSLNVVGQI